MYSAPDSTDVSVWVPHLQRALQQQIAQVGQQVLAFKDLQVHCTIQEETLLITAELGSPMALAPQKILWALEQLVIDYGLGLPPMSSDSHSLSLRSLSESRSIQLCLILTDDAQGHKCHSFTLFLTGSAFEAASAHLTGAEVESISGEFIHFPNHDFPNHDEPAIEEENREIPEIFPPITTLALPPSFDIRSSTSNLSWFNQIFQSWRQINSWIFALVGVGCLSVGIGYYLIAFNRTEPASTTVSSITVSPDAVMALGRIEPKGDTIKLSVANAQDSRVNQLLVEEGDFVKAGQVIAILQGLDKKNAAVLQAQQNVEIAQAKFAKTQAGDGKNAELAAQRSQIARLEAQLATETVEKQAAIGEANTKLRQATTLYQRYQMLYDVGATSRSELDQKQAAVETAQSQLAMVTAQLNNVTSTLQQEIQQAKAFLANLLEVRPVDMGVAQAEVNYAQTQVAQAKAELEDLYVRAPIAGQILKINTRVGEQVNTLEGIVELGQTDQMYAIAEVYETDVRRIKQGQQATIVSENGGFVGEIYGKVDRIGAQIKKKNILDSDPAAEKDARVVEVKVRLRPEDTPKVAKLTNLQVRVRIDLTS